jgi:hypothetical protein
MKTVNRDNINMHLIKYQLAMVDKTLLDTIDDDMWFFNITMTQNQHEKFKTYAVALIKKVFKCNKNRALETFDWFNLGYGLRIKN